MRASSSFFLQKSRRKSRNGLRGHALFRVRPPDTCPWFIGTAHHPTLQLPRGWPRSRSVTRAAPGASEPRTARPSQRPALSLTSARMEGM